MVSRRRNHSEADAAPAQQNQQQQQPAEEPGLLHRLRNCWEFANLMQYISMFGKVMKIDENFGIEVNSFLPLSDCRVCSALRAKGIDQRANAFC